jgi:cell wall assembly regulator SMI1
MSIQTPEELEALKRIGRIVALALKEMAASVRPGMTTLELDQIGEAVQTLLPEVQKTLRILSADLDGLQTTINEANDLLNDSNRANVASTLKNLNGTLAD